MENGLILLNKKEGKSTTYAETPLKKIFNTKKVGHLGTLDPFASGLIICGINKGNKLFPLLENLNKTYIASLKLGNKTSSLDLTGEIIATKQPFYHSLEEIDSVLSSFLGKSKQLPPMYSAIKIDGIPLYKLARKNIDIERKEREINIYSYKLISYENDTITFEVEVSKGTYIRSLGEDIANKLNEYGHLISLKRTKIGQFNLDKAKYIEDITNKDLISIEEVLSSYPKYYLDDKKAKYILNGHPTRIKSSNKLLAMVYQSKIIAIYKQDEENELIYKPYRMF